MKKNSAFYVRGEGLIPRPFRAGLLILVFILFSLHADGGILFSDLDLSPDNRLLFRAGILNQDAFFLTNLGDGGAQTLKSLSAFPEKMDLLDNGRILQIRNAFGAMWLPLTGGLPVPIPGVSSFEGEALAAGGRAEEMISSPDGRWILYLNPVSSALGDLVMLDVHTGVKTLVASALDRPETVFPATWSPDSRFFLYERGGRMFFFITGSSLMPPDEKLRLVGEGTVNSIFWGIRGDFYYLQGSTLYRVRGPELFARTLYADFLSMGAVAGKIPFEFDPCFDNFWLAPDALSLLVSKGRRSLYCFPLESSGVSETALSYIMLPRYCSGVNVLWSIDGTLTVLVSTRENGRSRANAWRLSPKAVFEPLLPPVSGAGLYHQGALSPDGKLAVFWGTGGVALYDYAGWKFIEDISARPGVFCIWKGNSEIITGDDQKIEIIHLGRSADASGSGANAGGTAIAGRDLLCLSGASQAGFEENSSRILAKSGDAWFVTDGIKPWAPISNPGFKNPSQVSSQYRVYLEEQGAGVYENLPMIRNMASVGTFSLFPVRQSPDFLRSPRAGKVALCFDLYDDDRGLPETLDALSRFGVKATFFLNGEFIRRHPLAAADIAAAGHEAASMFFALIDLSDIRYRTDSDFITRGLARNEDEFYKATGRELSLIWHAPWYTASPNISAAAARAGYASAGRDVDPMDWVSLNDEKKLGFPQRSPSEMVDYILKNIKPGSIVPVRLGLLSGGRNDYLFNRVNVLLDALLREGYTVTTVSDLGAR